MLTKGPLRALWGPISKMSVMAVAGAMTPFVVPLVHLSTFGEPASKAVAESQKRTGETRFSTQ